MNKWVNDWNRLDSESEKVGITDCRLLLNLALVLTMLTVSVVLLLLTLVRVVVSNSVRTL